MTSEEGQRRFSVEALVPERNPYPTDEALDPLYRNARREARWALGLWLVCFAYSATYCYLHGYSSYEPHPGATGVAVGSLLGTSEWEARTVESLETPWGLGIPDWVFHGIVCPWVVASFLTIVFCLFVFRDDPLGAEPEPERTPTAGARP